MIDNAFFRNNEAFVFPFVIFRWQYFNLFMKKIEMILPSTVCVVLE